MTRLEAIEVEATVLARAVVHAADDQTTPPIAVWLSGLAAALADLAGDPDLTPWPTITPDADAEACARAMTDVAAPVQVPPAIVDLVAALLAPTAAAGRVGYGELGSACAAIITAALNRLSLASAAAEPSDDELVDEIEADLKLHEAECPYEPPAVRWSPVVRCPCKLVWAFRCSKCGAVVRSMVQRGTRCPHVDGLCRGDLAGWIDLDEVA